ncbi:mannose-6-phosphate isomerase [Breznakia sp. OttesenSCG-928-G09]|nr:mannose-6-phosphate isomerase [Breznakia sp. OttesenSCG-928-G09]
MYPLKLKPIYDETIWAGDKLTKIRGVDATTYGTSWEVSAHPYCQNEILNGEYEGKTLQDLLSDYPKAMLGNVSKEKILRCAFLDAQGDLSIQVHPYTEYAKKHDNDYGKTESWYVLDAQPGATLVAGTKTTDVDVIKKAINDENLEEYLVYHDIKAGDFIHINAGMLHALGGGILAIEVGTNSNTTYRFYDYGRKDASGNGRELHLDKSFDVVDLKLQSSVIHTPLENNETTKTKTLVDCDDYIVEVIDVVGEIDLQTNGSFNTLTFVHGGGEIEYNKQTIKNDYTDSLFIPAACEEYKVKGNCRVLRSYVKD